MILLTLTSLQVNRCKSFVSYFNLLAALLLISWSGISIAHQGESHVADHSLSDADLAAMARARDEPAFASPILSAENVATNLSGVWGSVVNWPFVFASAANLPDGRILAWGGNQKFSFSGGSSTYAAVWDPITGNIQERNHTNHSMFCAIPTMLEDGRVFVNGGDGTRERVSTFDYRSNSWQRVEDMNTGRWYPGSVALADGRVFTMIGEPGGVYPEAWTENQGWSLLTGANLDANLLGEDSYQNNWLPYIHLAPNGKIFHSGPTNKMNYIDPVGNGSISATGLTNTWYPKYSTGIMFAEGKILVAGGGTNSFSSSAAGSKKAMVIDLNGASPTKQNIASMKYARKFNNGVMLPNGEVLIIGGNTSGIEFSDQGSILTPEIWNPETGVWRDVAAMSVPRNYHSVALLMPDGRVWSGGGGLCGCSADHPNAQVFSPPYLYKPNGSLATRPVITQAPGVVGYGSKIRVAASANIQKFTLIKMAGITHSLNSDLRFLQVPFTSITAGQYDLSLHANPNVLTPGYWMLFALAADGTPSVAKVINISSSLTPILNGLVDQSALVAQKINFQIEASDPNGDVLSYQATGLPDGLTLNAGTGLVTGTISATSRTVYQVSLQVSDGINTAVADFKWHVVLPKQPQSHWLFDETSGSQVLDQLGGRHGQMNAGVTWVSGQKNGAVCFDGSSGQISLNQEDLTSPWTASMWVKRTGNTESSTLLESDTYALRLEQWSHTRQIGFTQFGIGDFQFNYSAGLNQWEHIAFVSSAGSTRLFVNGQLQGSQPSAIPLPLTRFGSDRPADHLLGCIDDVKIYDSALAPEEINAFYGNDLHQGPRIVNPGEQSSKINQQITLQLQVNAGVESGLIHRATGLPNGLSIHPGNGLITGVISQAGQYNVVISVEDNNGSSDQISFLWRVTSPIALSLEPILTQPQSSNVGVQYSAIHAGGSSVRFKWLFGDGSAETAYSNDPNITHIFQGPGQFIVTLTATDDSNVVVTEQFQQLIHLPLTPQQPVVSMSVIYQQRNGNDYLWNVNPDNNSVTAIDVSQRRTIAEIPVGQGPRALALAPNGNVWVTNKHGATLSIIDSESLAVQQTVSLPYASQPFGLVFAPDASAAYLVLEGAGKLLKLNPVNASQLAAIDVGKDPRHVSIDGVSQTIYVSRFITPPVPGEATATPQFNNAGGEVMVIDAASLQITKTILLQNSDAPDAEHSGRGLPNYLGPLIISPDGQSGWLPSKQDNLQRGVLRDGQPLDHDHTVRSIASLVDLASAEEQVFSRVDHDNGGIASSAIFGPYGHYLFVALEGSQEVAVLNAHTATELFRFAVGRAPQGLSLSADGNTVFVHNFMDRTVSMHDITGLLSNQNANVAQLATIGTVSNEQLSPQVLRGKRLFYDAKDSRLARDAYMSCAACHNDGEQDGRVWDFTGAGEGLRNTTSLQGRAGTEHGPLHWSANFDEVQDFEGQIRDLARGTGLMADTDFHSGTRHLPLGDTKAGVSADLDALSAYVASLQTIPASPFRQQTGESTALAQAGRDVFVSNNCQSCHSGPTFTDSAPDNLHDIGTLKASSGGRLGATLTGIDTPTLLGVWSTAPYLHDGSALSVEAAVKAHQGIVIDPTSMQKLVAYLQQLDRPESGEPLIKTRVWIDSQSNDAIDPQETGAENVLSYLFDENWNWLAEGLSDADGLLDYPGIGLGKYYVCYDVATFPAEHKIVSKHAADDALDSDVNVDGCSDLITLTSQQPEVVVGIGLAPGGVTAQVINTAVWLDEDGNGLRSSSELGISNVLSWLFDESWNWLDEGFTNANGVFSYKNLAEGLYHICFDPFTYPDNLGITHLNAGDDNIDSDVHLDGCVDSISLSGASGQSRQLGLSALTQPAAIGDLLWSDTNGNGLQEAAEPGIAGVAIWMFDANWNWQNETVTDTNGSYNLVAVPGNYHLCFDLTAISNATVAARQTGPVELDNDAYADGCTDLISIGPGQQDQSRDLGVIIP